MKLLITFLVLSLTILSAKIPLIVDTDGDVDDLISITTLLKAEEIDLRGITTTLLNEPNDVKVSNILNLTGLVGRTDLPVSYATEKSLSPFIKLPEFWGELPASLRRLELKKCERSASNLPSHQLLIDLIEKSSEKVSILCIAPLTNLALALREKPSIRDNIERVYIMGGAIDVPGNLNGFPSGNVSQFAEFNLILDVTAADEVLHSGVDITLIPLDASNKVSLLTEIYRRLIRLPERTNFAMFVQRLIEPFVIRYNSAQGYFLDLIASLLVIDPTLGRYQNAKVMINSEKGAEYGRLMLHRKGSEVRVCLGIFTARLFDRLTAILQN